MLLRVYVDTPGEFDRWLANQRKPAVNDPAVREDRKTFFAQSCINCPPHRRDAGEGQPTPRTSHI